MKTLSLIIATIGSLASFSCLAQSNVGELLDKGGKQMTKEEILEKYKNGGKYVRKREDGVNINLNVKADRSVSGNASSSRGSTGIFGSWDLDETGQICLNYVITVLNDRSQDCGYVFSLGADRFGARTLDRGEPIMKSGFVLD